MSDVAANAAVTAHAATHAATTRGSSDAETTDERAEAMAHLNGLRAARQVVVGTSVDDGDVWAPLFALLSSAGLACKKGYITDNERHAYHDLVLQTVMQLMPLARDCVAERLRRAGSA